MIEVRFHGRGGQGSVIASNILAEAAFLEGKQVSAFPFFGVERRGAPVTAYVRVDEHKIRIKSGIYKPNYVVVLDPTLVKAVNIAEGLKPNGSIIINSVESPTKMRSELKLEEDKKVATVDATDIAITHRLGSKAAPIVNSAILGGFTRVSGLVEMDSLVKAVRRNVPVKLEENEAAARDAFEQVVME